MSLDVSLVLVQLPPSSRSCVFLLLQFVDEPLQRLVAGHDGRVGKELGGVLGVVLLQQHLQGPMGGSEKTATGGWHSRQVDVPQ